MKELLKQVGGPSDVRRRKENNFHSYLCQVRAIPMTNSGYLNVCKPMNMHLLHNIKSK
jgi:hypothetical protein